MDERNIAIVLTPPGAAAIAVVRIAGPGVGEFLAAHFSRRAAPLRCVHGELKGNDGAVIDDPVVVLSSDGGWADINLHGGPWVVASALELLRRSGFEVFESEPGQPLPFHVLEGESVLEREVAAYLPLAKTEPGVRMLLAQPANWRNLLGRPIPADAPRNILLSGDLRPVLFPKRVAIVGAPNVGKSTLANQLFAQQRSITADVPGTTRDWVGEIANLDGLPVMLLDTPGVRQSDDPIEQAAIARSGGIVGGADVIVYVLDASRPPEPQQERLLRRLVADGFCVIPVHNKADRIMSPANALPPSHALMTVATTGQGVEALRRAIRARFGFEQFNAQRIMWWTDRHHELLLRARGDPDHLHEMLK